MIKTRSAFYYGHKIDQNNLYLDFQENGGPALVAQIKIGEYAFKDFLDAIASAMNEAGSQVYTVTANRKTRIISISAATTTFKLLAGTGNNVGRGPWSLIGISSDTGLSLTHIGTLASGEAWKPQFFTQDFIDFENNQSAIDGTIRQSTSGKVEAVKFGIKKIMECSFKFITNIPQIDNNLIENSQTAVDDVRAFLEYATNKYDLEFIPDRDNPDVFVRCILESTEESQDGLAFKIKEEYPAGLPGYFRTGLLRFRKV